MLKRYNKKRLLRIVAFLTRLPLLLLLIFPRDLNTLTDSEFYHLLFLSIFFVYYLANPLVFPTINLFLKNVYEHKHFGRLYGYATSLNKIVMLLATFGFGLLLDYDPFAFAYIYPILAVLGIASVCLLSKIPYQEVNRPAIKTKFWQSVRKVLKNLNNIVVKNKPFRHYEIGFMFYGFSFMSSATVINLFFDEALHLNYSSVAFYKNAYNVLAIALLPFFGRLIGNVDPRKFGMISFASMLLYIASLIFTEHFPLHFEWLGLHIYWGMLVYILFHGVFAATMALMWHIGSAYFCTKEEAGDYQSVHLSLTGFRAIFAPLLGVLFYELYGFTVAFSIAILSLLIGIGIMYWSYRNLKIHPPSS